MLAPDRPTDLLLGWTASDPPARLGFAPPSQPPGEPDLPIPDLPIYAEPEGHLVTIAPTGAGKGRSAIIPALLDYAGPAIVIDPKGEACAVTSRHRATLGPVVRLDPYLRTGDRSGALNPFDLVATASLEPVEAALLLASLLAPPSFSKDPFWDNRATSLLSGLIAAVLTTAPPEERHPVTVRNRLTSDDPVYSLAVLLDTVGKQMPPFAYQEIAQFLQLSERETRPSVLATATQHLTILGEEAVAATLRETTFDLDAVRRGDPLTIYLVLPVEKLASHGRLLRLWTATLLRTLSLRTSRPDHPTLLLLDEAAQLGPLDDLVTATTLLRGYGVRVWSFWQNVQQLSTLYPTHWQTILENARTLQVFGTHWVGRSALAALLDVPPDALVLAPDRQILIAPDGTRTTARKADYLVDEPFEGRYDPNPLHQGRSGGPLSR